MSVYTTSFSRRRVKIFPANTRIRRSIGWETSNNPQRRERLEDSLKSARAALYTASLSLLYARFVALDRRRLPKSEVVPRRKETAEEEDERGIEEVESNQSW